MKLELVVLPVSDVDRAKAFYERLGFRLDVDHQPNDDFRVVQFTPSGSECSITFGKASTRPSPGATTRSTSSSPTSKRHARISSTGASRSPSRTTSGPDGQTTGVDPQRADYGTFASFDDPDGNGWLLQEVRSRNPEH